MGSKDKGPGVEVKWHTPQEKIEEVKVVVEAERKREDMMKKGRHA